MPFCFYRSGSKNNVLTFMKHESALTGTQELFDIDGLWSLRSDYSESDELNEKCVSPAQLKSTSRALNLVDLRIILKYYLKYLNLQEV